MVKFSNFDHLAKHQKYQFLSFGMNQNFKPNKKRKISKKKKSTKISLNEVGGSVKVKKKGYASD